jgi:hypothetical protein
LLQQAVDIRRSAKLHPDPYFRNMLIDLAKVYQTDGLESKAQLLVKEAGELD